MNLYLLRPRPELVGSVAEDAPPGSPWEPWYDKCFGFVVRAENEAEARALAAENAHREPASAWLSEELSTCAVLTVDGPAEIVMEDVSNA